MYLKILNTKKTSDFCIFFSTLAFLKYPPQGAFLSQEKVGRPRFIVPLSLFDLVQNSTGAQHDVYDYKG